MTGLIRPCHFLTSVCYWRLLAGSVLALLISGCSHSYSQDTSTGVGDRSVRGERSTAGGVVGKIAAEVNGSARSAPTNRADEETHVPGQSLPPVRPAFRPLKNASGRPVYAGWKIYPAGDADYAFIDRYPTDVLRRKKVKQLLDRARKAEAAGRPVEALQQTRLALLLEPDDRDSIYRRAMLLYELGRFPLAREGVERLLERNSRDVDALDLRGMIRRKQGFLDAAAADYRKAIELAPRDARAYFYLANLYFGTHQYGKAQPWYDRALALDPGNPLFLANRADNLNALGRRREALEDVDRALDKHPHQPAFLSIKAATLTGLKRYRQALSCVDEAIEHQPGNGRFYYVRGFILTRLNRTEDGIKSIRRSLAINPDFMEALILLGRLYMERGELDRARSTLDRAIAAHPNSARAYFLRGQVYSKMGELEQSMMDFEHGRKLVAEGQKSAGGDLVLPSQAVLEEVADGYSAIVNVTPDAASAYYNRAFANFALRRYGRAADDFDRYLALAESSGVGAVYAMTFIRLAGERASDTASKVSGAALKSRRRQSGSPGWPGVLVGYLDGGAKQAELYALARGRGSESMARCVIGLHLLHLRKIDEAAKHLLWVARHGDPSSDEYMVSLAELWNLQTSYPERDYGVRRQ